MIIPIPFTYDVTGILPRHRTLSTSTGLDNVYVDVKEVDSEELSLAATIYNNDGSLEEQFFKFGDSFYIRNFRDDGSTLRDKHLHLLGRYLSDPNHSYGTKSHQRQAEIAADTRKRNARALRSLTDTGLLFVETLKYQSASRLDDGAYSEPFKSESWGYSVSPSNPATDFRQVDRDNHAERAAHVREYITNNAIMVDGQLFMKIPEPILLVYDHSVDWAFVKPNGRDRFDPSTKFPEVPRYVLALSDWENIDEIVPDATGKRKVDIFIDDLDPDCFRKIDRKPALLADIQVAFSYSVRLSDYPTRTIMMWCDLRDMIAERMGWQTRTQFHGSGLAAVMEQDDEFLDLVAEKIVELSHQTKDIKANGALFWRGKEIELSISDNAIGMKF